MSGDERTAGEEESPREQGRARLSRSETLVALRTKVEQAIAGLRPDDADPMEIELGDHAISQDCPHKAYNVEEPYVETATKAAARIALAALVDSAGFGNPGVEPTPPARIERVLDDPAVLSPRLAEWLSELEPAGLGMVQQAALGWMLDTIELATRRGEPKWTDGTLWHKAKSGTLSVSLRSRCHATRSTGSGAEERLFLYRTQRRPTSADAPFVRRMALVHGVATGVVPAGVVLGFRSSLTQQRFDIDDAAIDAAVAEVADEARTVLDPESAERVPGPQCSYCVLQFECGPGMDHLRSILPPI